MKSTMPVVLAATLALGAAAFLFRPGAAVAAEPTTQEAAVANTYVATVEGMTCQSGCAPRVQKAIQKLDGVAAVEVDVEAKTATIRMEPGKSISREDCEKALGGSRYTVSAFAPAS